MFGKNDSQKENNKLFFDKYEQRQDLCERLNSPDEKIQAQAKEELIAALDKYIYYIIHKNFAGYIKIIEDLSQAGKLAALEHCHEYSPNYKLSTFFAFFIQNAMQDLVNNENGDSHYYAESKHTLFKAARNIDMDAENIDSALLSIHTGIPESRVNSIISNTFDKKRVELIEADDATLGGFFDSPEKEVMRREFENEIQDAINSLPELEQIAVKLKFGFYLPEINERGHVHTINEIRDIFQEKKYTRNALATLKTAKKHLQDILSSRGYEHKKNMYEEVRDEAGLKFENDRDAQDLFAELIANDL